MHLLRLWLAVAVAWPPLEAAAVFPRTVPRFRSGLVHMKAPPERAGVVPSRNVVLKKRLAWLDSRPAQVLRVVKVAVLQVTLVPVLVGIAFGAGHLCDALHNQLLGIGDACTYNIANPLRTFLFLLF